MEPLESRSDFRPVRVVVPILVSFASHQFTVREFTLNLSEAGLFLPTELICPVGTRGTLTFRASRFDHPFTLRAEVVRVVAPGHDDDERPCGWGIRFLEVSNGDLEKLRQVVDGVRDGSVVQAIRRSLDTGGGTLLEELRKRPLDQLMMLATAARGDELTALIRLGNQSVLQRLLDSPRLQPYHLTVLLRDRNVQGPILSIVRKTRALTAHDEAMWLFCVHPNAAIAEIMSLLPLLPVHRLNQVAQDQSIRTPVSAKAREIALGRKTPVRA